MRNRSVLGAAVWDAVVVHACCSRTAARRSHKSHSGKEGLPPIYELFYSTLQSDFDAEIPPIGLKWLTVILFMYVQRYM